jgi:hypothetical protein
VVGEGGRRKIGGSERRSVVVIKSIEKPEVSEVLASPGQLVERKLLKLILSVSVSNDL